MVRLHRWMMMRNNLPKLIFLCGLLVAFGCANNKKKVEMNNLLFTDKDIAGIFETYQKDATKAKKKREAVLGAKIRRLEVVRDGKKKGFLVSADLNNAPLGKVIDILLTKSKTQYFLNDLTITGFVSGRFEKMPFLRAVNIFLNSQGFSASFSSEGVLFIEEGVPDRPAAAAKKPPSPPQSFRKDNNNNGTPAQFSTRFQRATTGFQRGRFLGRLVQDSPAEGATPPAAEGAVPPPTDGVPPPPSAGPPPEGDEAPAAPAAVKKPSDPEITVEHPLLNLNVKSANQVLSKLFGGGGGEGEEGAPGGGAGGVLFSVEETRNTVIIKGKRSQVRKIKRVLRTIDRKPQHVLIEVLVLEVDSDALEELNIGVSDYAQKRYSALASAVGTEGSNALTFTYQNLVRGDDAFSANLAFTGLVKLLYRKNLARIIARPYLAALTGKESTLRITEDRTIVVTGGGDSASKEVASGVELKITPTVHLSGIIEMSLDIEQSDFLPSTGNIATSKDTNKASTVMQVPSGQSMIIGGLMLNSRSSSNAGLPWLRRIPFLNLFTASRQRTQVDKEVLIVVTPHLYSPGLRTPLPFLKVFQKPVDQNLLRATPTESGDTTQY